MSLKVAIAPLVGIDPRAIIASTVKYPATAMRVGLIGTSVEPSTNANVNSLFCSRYPRSIFYGVSALARDNQSIWP
ncbi:hypothetical protein U2F10_06865 [Leptothoe sp. EHU-05/26/07-4]